MTAKLTAEQLSALTAHPGEPVPLADGSGDVVGYLVTTAALDNLQALRSLIKQGEDSPDVPAEAAHARIRQMAEDAAKKYA